MFFYLIQTALAAITQGEDASPLEANADIDQLQPMRSPPLPRPMSLEDASRPLPICDAVKDPDGDRTRNLKTHKTM